MPMQWWRKITNYTVLNLASVYGGYCRKKQLKDSQRIDSVSEKQLLDFVHKNKNTVYGQKYGFDHIHTIQDYQDQVPFTTYDDYRDYVSRIAENGEQNVLTADKVVFFAKTSGTSGEMKRIPVVKKATRPYTETVAVFMNIIHQEMKKRGIHCGRGLNTVEIETHTTQSGIKEGLISAYTLQSARLTIPVITCFPKEIFGYGEGVDMKYLKAFYALKDRDLAYMAAVFMSNLTDLMTYIFENTDRLIEDIAQGHISNDIVMPEILRTNLNKNLRPDTERAEELRKIFREHSHSGIMTALWPKLCIVIGIGTGEFEGFAKKMRDYCGENVSFYHETYSSSEALIANAVDVECEDYRILTDSAFFEFIPVGKKAERPLLRHELKVGQLYEIVITNWSGLYRYRIKDVVRVTGFEGKNPLIRFAYRKNQVINITGVKLTAEHITHAMKEFEKTTGLHIADYTLYPDTSHSPWRIMLFLETEEEISSEQKIRYAHIFDEKLSAMNREHGRMLQIGETDPSVICQVERNTFREYREFRMRQGASQNQIKTSRVINSPEVLKLFMDHTRIS